MNSGFESFSTQHFAALFTFGVITYVVIQQGKSAPEETRTRLGLILAGLTFSSLIIETLVKSWEGTYDFLTDLPLFLCDLVAIVLPFVLYVRHRKWIGILYFWAMAGTVQALITPELEHGFPSFHFFRYFITHAGIVTTILYTVVVWQIRITWKDFFNAVLYAQFYLLAVHLINTLLGSNYSYTIHKPFSTSLLDLFGPWPWYILGGELLMVILFLLVFAPFLLFRANKDPESARAGSFGDG